MFIYANQILFFFFFLGGDSKNRRRPPIVYIPFTLFAAIILFVTSSHVDLLEQTAAHEETHARIGVHTNKISTIDRDNNSKEGTGLRRSPMLVSEKSSHGSPGHGTGTGIAGSTVDSPNHETRYLYYFLFSPFQGVFLV